MRVLLRLAFSFLLTAALFSLVLGGLALLAESPGLFAFGAVFLACWAYAFSITTVRER